LVAAQRWADVEILSKTTENDFMSLLQVLMGKFITLLQHKTLAYVGQRKFYDSLINILNFLFKLSIFSDIFAPKATAVS